MKNLMWDCSVIKQSAIIEKVKLNFSSLFFTAEGQAQSKKLARRKAAIIVLEEMKKVIEAEEKEKPQQECSLNRYQNFSYIYKSQHIVRIHL